jgi:hypothetical protein
VARLINPRTRVHALVAANDLRVLVRVVWVLVDGQHRPYGRVWALVEERAAALQRVDHAVQVVAGWELVRVWGGEEEEGGIWDHGRIPPQ